MTDAATEKAQAAHAGLEAPRTIVVIGGGQAAGWIVKTLRKEGFDGRLVMIADEVHLPYERPPLSKAVLAGEADIETVRLVKPDDFERSERRLRRWRADTGRDERAKGHAKAPRRKGTLGEIIQSRKRKGTVRR